MSKTFTSSKRFVPISTYCKQSGLSYATVTHMLNSNQLNYITTESGQRRIDTKPTETEQGAVIARLDKQERLLKKLSAHLGVEEQKGSNIL